MNPLASAAPSLPEQPPSSRFPGWLLGIGLVAVAGSGALAARLIWEQTVWTWERGPQNIGFSLVHGSGAMLVFFPFLLLLWLAVSAAYMFLRLLRRRRLSRVCVIAVTLSIFLLGLLSLPYGFWQRLFVARLASGPHAAQFVVYAAAVGDLATVKAFLARGIPVDVRDRDGKTGLYGAAVEGQTEVIKYLIAAGADVNAIDLSGDSPLEVANEMNREEAARYLSDHGARAIHGSEEQRKKAAEDSVRVPYPAEPPCQSSQKC
jgi:Ankyrin repeats (3 copies)